ncbi:rRNA methyltransferase [Kyrpidia spormannii]|uniref:rRNA methyltransferase n=1 Tax=Kyrpidia spormannii TaxID=2055160 RepID=A0A2K8N840_9BACL|nr:RNA methyltransferase [Kyrpidia spormannii]ATY85498.1 rRNA methyltransferase [Kyrpidia spormannii]
MGEEEIRSLQNARVKEWAALRRGKERRRRGLFLAEGPHLVGEALHSGLGIEVVLFDPRDQTPEVASLVEEARGKGCPVQPADRRVLERVCEVITPQGIAAVVRIPEWPIPGFAVEAPEEDPVLMVALDGIQDPGNVGAVLRVARAVGVAGVLCGEDTADPFSPKAVRSSMGAAFTVPIRQGRLVDMIGEWHAKGVEPVETAVGEGVRYDRWNWNIPVMIVLGNEGRGISPEVRQLCRGKVHIPMPGGGESLNVAVAAALLLYEARRHRGAL